MTKTPQPGSIARVDGLRVAASHPSLAGHFPGHPIVPGVVLLDEVLAVIQQHRPGFVVAVLPAVKFLSPLLPDESFSVRLEPVGLDFRFECFTAERMLARGSLRARDDRQGPA